MSRFPRAATAIAGLATYGVGRAPGLSSLDIAGGAALAAVRDAGLALRDVDALFCCLPDDMLSGLALAEYLGLQPRFTDSNCTGGSAFMSHLATAAAMIEAGMVDSALIAYGLNQLGGGGRLATSARSNGTRLTCRCFRSPPTRPPPNATCTNTTPPARRWWRLSRATGPTAIPRRSHAGR